MGLKLLQGIENNLFLIQVYYEVYGDMESCLSNIIINLSIGIFPRRNKYICSSWGSVLCNSKNKPPALQGEGISLDKRINSCVMIEVGLQNHK